MNTILENFHFGDGLLPLTLQVFVIVIATLLLGFIIKRILHRLERKIKQTEPLWDDALYHAMMRPLSALIWLIGLTFAADIILNHTDVTIFQVTGTVRKLGVIVIIGWFLYRLVAGMEKNVLLRGERLDKPVDKTTVNAIGKLIRLSIIITAALVILQTLGFSISGVLAFGGVGGIAIGFAAKDLLANFFGGLMIYLDRPFAEGDWIRSPDRAIEGTVEKIGWRLTRIQTFDNRPLYIPNAAFTSIAVENPSRMSHRRIKETIGIRYEDAAKIADIVRETAKMLKEHPGIDPSQSLIVNFTRFAPSSLDFFIYAFTSATDGFTYYQIKQDILLKIVQIIEDHDAEIAFPTSTVHLADGFDHIGEKETG